MLDYECDICDKIFVKARLLRNHMEIFHGIFVKDHGRPTPFRCQMCDKYFFQEHILRAHISIIHDEQKTVKCEFCDNEFKKLRSYIGHMRNIHKIKKKKYLTKSRRRFKCDLCDKKGVPHLRNPTLIWDPRLNYYR